MTAGRLVRQALDRVLDNDHRSVDNETDGDRKSAKAHEVGAHACQLHHAERHQRRHGQGRRHD